MRNKLVTVAVALAVVSQGIAHADEPAPPGVTVVRDRAALAAHIDALEEGDRVAVATDDGIVAGEFVDKDADDVVIDQPLIHGGAERVTIPRREIQGVQYQQRSKGRLTVQDRILIAVVVAAGAFLVWARLAGLGGP
jgi:hypothetical protein